MLRHKDLFTLVEKTKTYYHRQKITLTQLTHNSVFTAGGVESLEKAIYTRRMEFIIQYNILSEQQYRLWCKKRIEQGYTLICQRTFKLLATDY